MEIDAWLVKVTQKAFSARKVKMQADLEAWYLLPWAVMTWAVLP